MLILASKDCKNKMNKNTKTICLLFFDPIAQLVERETVNLEAVRSNLTGIVFLIENINQK